MKYSRPIRILHLLLAAGITAQLALSLVMEVPKPGRTLDAFQAFAFEAHENLGVALLAVLMLHWLFFFMGHAHRGMGNFFPWFSRERLAGLAAEVKDMLRLRVSDPEAQSALAGAIQGLGLAVASLLAVSGTVLYFGMGEDGSMSSMVHAVKEFHGTLGPVMWGYLAIHAGAAMLHRFAFSHRSILSIFELRFKAAEGRR